MRGLWWLSPEPSDATHRDWWRDKPASVALMLLDRIDELEGEREP